MIELKQGIDVTSSNSNCILRGGTPPEEINIIAMIGVGWAKPQASHQLRGERSEHGKLIFYIKVVTSSCRYIKKNIKVRFG